MVDVIDSIQYSYEVRVNNLKVDNNATTTTIAMPINVVVVVRASAIEIEGREKEEIFLVALDRAIMQL